MPPDALEQGVKVHNELQNLVDSDPLTGETLEQWFMGLVQRVKDLPHQPPKIDYYSPEQAARLRDFELYLNSPVTFPMHGDTEEERIRRSLAFHEFFPKPLPAHLWLLTDPPSEAPDHSRRCWRIRLKPSPDVLAEQLRQRRRRRNHVP